MPDKFFLLFELDAPATWLDGEWRVIRCSSDPDAIAEHMGFYSDQWPSYIYLLCSWDLFCGLRLVAHCGQGSDEFSRSGGLLDEHQSDLISHLCDALATYCEAIAEDCDRVIVSTISRSNDHEE